ncbi:hypothetical protein PG990_002229 [Apiospora arundinis]|uniref:Uncharacterized protein n=1 Tax=Apiospora arundinis TaxID=335852 RepID=A0ABR2I435_9PEZI
MNSISPFRVATAAARSLSRRLPSPAAAMTTKSTTQTLLPRSRFYSSSSSSAEPERKSFIKVFGRPIFKVALMAIFTYQLAYYGWLRLEQNETRGVLNDTIADLETRIAELERAKGNTKKA